jgi:peptidoglycan lytic transglycosylase G
MHIDPKKKKLLVGAAVVTLLVVLPLVRFGMFLTRPAGDGHNERLVSFAEGTSLRKFARELESSGIISNASLFVIYARIRGADAKAKAGSYQLSDGLTPAEILRRMVAGDVFAYHFTVPEGYSIYQVAELLENQGIFDKGPFLKECTNRSLLDDLNIKGKSVEGYLFPSTYTVPPEMTEAGLIRMMVGKFDKVYAQKFAERAGTLPLSETAIITIASIIEKEAVIPAERPLIASVFLNRLNRRMPLQSDPTAVYGVRAFTGKVSKRDIMRRSPYNTYLIQGLPPGPIGNPGMAAIEAVIAPSATSYLYFVARKDGSHAFSRTLEEHNRAVRKYLK